jgi:hypothetical protein
MFYLVGLVCNGGRRFAPAGFSFIPLQLPLAPMRLFAFNSRADGLHEAQKPSTTDARKIEFIGSIQSDLPCPDRQLKIFLFTSDPNQLRIPCHPVPREGALAIVTDVGAGSGGREGCD